MSNKLKVTLVLVAVAIIFLLIGQVIGVQIGALIPKEIHSGKLEEKPAMLGVSFGKGDFSMTLPEGWVSDGKRAWNQNNPTLFITGGSYTPNDEYAKLIAQGKVREFEIQRNNVACGEQDLCGKLTDFKMVKAPEGVQNFEFFVTYQGTGIDRPQGFTTELHRTVLAKGKLYRFWTSTDSSAGKNAGEFQNFRSIVDTFEAK